MTLPGDNPGRRQVICLTPVKNESWILELFLRATSLWADRIILADQFSTDSTREIAGRFEKVQLIENPSKTFNEPERQELLIAEARKIPGPKILIALDADEIFTANVLGSLEWTTMLNAPRGTGVYVKLANIRPDFMTYWTPNLLFLIGFVDDGSPHEGHKIHSPRLPKRPDGRRLVLSQVKLMHFQFIDWKRMASKHRWYQSYEVLFNDQSSICRLYRTYHHMYAVHKSELKPIPADWFGGYLQRHIAVDQFEHQTTYWWDGEVLDLMAEHTPQVLVRLAIWDEDWIRKARSLGYPSPDRFADPRGGFLKAFHWYLKHTQSIGNLLPVRAFDKFLQALGL